MKDLKLDRRDQITVSLAGLAVIFVLLLLMYIPAGPRRAFERSTQDLASLQQDLEMTQLLKLEEQLRQQSQQQLKNRLESRPENFDVFAYVNSKLQQSNLISKAELTKYAPRNASPKQPMVKLKLEGVSFKELVNFLHLVYAGENLVAVYKLDRLEPAAQNRGLTCDVTFVTIKV